MSHKFDSLFYVYDVGFRWGPPDLVYPDHRAPGDGKLGIYKMTPEPALSVGAAGTSAGSVYRTYSAATCEVPGCYICKRDREGNLYPRFP